MNELLSPEKVAEIVDAHYPLGKPVFCKLIRRGFNDHYLVHLEGGRFVFRVYLNGKYYIESFEDYAFELELLDHLHRDNVPVAHALSLVNGERLGRVGTKQGERAFALFSYVPGVEADRESLTLEQSFRLGKTMAEMHLSLNRFRSRKGRYRLDLTYLVEEPLRLISAEIGKNSSGLASQEEQAALAEMVEGLGPIDDLVATVEQIDCSGDEFGLIHADMNLGNVRFQGDEPWLYDFDHCGFGWRAYDVSICRLLPAPQGEAMLHGYESVRTLSASERGCLATFSTLRRVWNVGDMMATESLRGEAR